jgi:hypothetical protein
MVGRARGGVIWQAAQAACAMEAEAQVKLTRHRLALANLEVARLYAHQTSKAAGLLAFFF